MQTEPLLEKKLSFESFGLRPEILRAVAVKQYTTPTPIQEKAIPIVLEGRDLIGCAQTGTGKTAAFALPILHRLQGTPWKGTGRRPIRVLVLTPTRELASQIAESFGAYGRNTALKHAIVFGGVNQGPQAQALRRGIDILVATPGRLLDLMSQGLVQLRTVETFVLDEADRMLDMGFIHDIRRVIDQLPAKRQTLFFSATMPREIQGLADTILRDPVRVAVTPVATPAEAVEQRVHYVEKSEKIKLLKHLLDGPAIKNALVFTRTKHGADAVTRQLERYQVRAEAIHGNKSQNAREKALSSFKRGDDESARGDGHRRPGPRHRRPVARGQLRPPERAGKLRPPDRTHGPGRRLRDRPVVLLLRRAALPRRHRTAHPQAPPGRGGPDVSLRVRRRDTDGSRPAACARRGGALPGPPRHAGSPGEARRLRHASRRPPRPLPP